MITLPRRLAVPSGRDLLVAAGGAAAVIGVAGALLGGSGVTVVVLALGAVLAAVALVAPVVALMLLVLASFGRTAATEVLPAEVHLPAMVLTVVAVLVALARRTATLPRMGAVEWLMIGYLGWNLLSMALPHAYPAEVPVDGSTIDLDRWLLGAVILPFVVYQVARTVLVDDRSVRTVLWLLVGLTAISTWLSIAQFYAPALTWPSYVVDAPNWPGRANGIFNQPVVNGLTLVVGLVVCLFLAERPGTGRPTRIGLYVLVAATAFAVSLTQTRAAMMGLAVAVLMGVVLARGWRRGFVAILAIGTVGLAARASTLLSADRAAGGYGSPSEIVDRLNAAATALQAIGEHPVVGIGVGRFGMYNTYQHAAWSDDVDWSRGQSIIAHENSLGIAAETGLLGLALWLAVVGGVGVLLWRAWRSLPGHETPGVAVAPLALVALMAMAVMLINGTTVDLRVLEFTTMLPFLLAGAVVGVLEARRRAPVEPPTVPVPRARARPGDDPGSDEHTRPTRVVTR